MTVKYNNVPKGTSDEHYTPKELFDQLGVTFDLDVAAALDNSNVPARKHYTKLDDGLSKEWIGNIWMNPPYSNPSPWVERFIAHNYGIALLPMTRGKWWDKLWASQCAVLPLIYNFSFNRPDGYKAKPIVFRTGLYAFGETNVTALKMSGLGRIR